MPRRVTAWACEHGCGRKVLVSRQAMERHEATCFHNPGRRACPSCAYDGLADEPWDRWCLAESGDWLSYSEFLIPEHQRPIAWNCPGWEASDA